MNEAASSRELDRGPAEIHVMPYCHADIAWVHTRAWHIDRYVRVMDEVLALLDANPEYHYYVDTWVELMKPYLEHRPEAREAIRRHVREGRLAVCGGQYGNVRSTAVGDETQVRNLQLGARRWREIAPEMAPRVHSNIDVTFGHSQMPQLLALAGIEAYLVMRPLAALDAQGIPRVFVWEGLSDDRVLVYRDTGVGLFQEHERHGSTWAADWPATRQHLMEAYLGEPAKAGTRAIGLTVGVDDSRPERFAFTDTPADYGALIRAWNEREPARMRYGTPDTLLDAIRHDAASLGVVSGPLDPTDVHFNIAPNGRRGIWWLRENADRRLVDAEILASLARLASCESAAPADFPEADFDELWEQLLSWTPHAVQWLFREDWQEGELALRGVAGAAARRISSAAADLVGRSLPMDAGGVALVNPLPSPFRGVTPLWIVNTDLTRGFAGLTGPDGHFAPVQVVDVPVPSAEVAILADVEAPGCGFAAFETRWQPVPSGLSYQELTTLWRSRYSLVDRQTIEGGCLAIESDRLRMTLVDGHVTRLEQIDAEEGGPYAAPSGASYLEPVCYAIERTGWHTDAVSEEPVRFEVEQVRLDESGPLRWRLTREGHANGFWIRQRLDLLRGECAVRSIIQFMDPADERDALLGVAVPVQEDADVEVDIPFGVEPRPVKQIRYGISERAIPGLIWGRTWARASSSAETLAVLAEDGDKLFRVWGSPRRLAHIMAQKTRVFDDGWTAYTDTHDVGGSQVFRHILALGSSADRQNLIDLAERARHPLTPTAAPRERLGASVSLLSVEPSTIRLSAMRWEGEDLILRLLQMAPDPAEAVVTLPFCVEAASLCDLRGKTMGVSVRFDGQCVRVPMRPWQIATLRVVRERTGGQAK